MINKIAGVAGGYGFAVCATPSVRQLGAQFSLVCEIPNR